MLYMKCSVLASKWPPSGLYLHFFFTGTVRQTSLPKSEMGGGKDLNLFLGRRHFSEETAACSSKFRGKGGSNEL